MGDERPVQLRKRLKTSPQCNLFCVVHYVDRDINEEVKPLTVGFSKQLVLPLMF
jgi:hypothetical protein